MADDEQPPRDQPGPPPGPRPAEQPPSAPPDPPFPAARPDWPSTPGGNPSPAEQAFPAARPDRPSAPGAHPHGPPPGATPPPAVVPGEAFDAEQWRRFQEFQEFKRFEEAQGQAPPPRRAGKPLWRKLVFNRWVRRLVVLLLLLIAASWAVDHYFGNPDADLPASETGGGKASRTVLFAESPREAIRMIYNNVAQATLPDACTRFETEELAQLFADHFNAPDCPTAIRRLHDEVTDASAYARPVFPAAVDLRPGADGTVVVSSCELQISAGPRLGEFTLRIIPGSLSNQWIISGHRKEAADCR
ncbi:hypothetical protein [Actinokineospora sp. UTMC 2448]|uniref:hypothetical protein n=1 Tax=Actinokineospora sp. UTMC 2448 TaxID=2268449 RepID=UPI002164CCAA|nr:hypothetical protein [Actinokineospora sp. UTMC 2448]